MRLITDAQLEAMLDDLREDHTSTDRRRTIKEHSSEISALPVEDRSLIVIKGAHINGEELRRLRTELFNATRARGVILVIPEADADVMTVLSDECHRLGLGPLFNKG